MFKFLGVTKKKGAEKSEILNNSWIPLGMQGLNARKWCDAMMLRDTPGDEIALFILCHMFDRHCAVVTSSKIWCTLETDGNATDDQLLSECELQLLYIESAVFSEMHLKPALPPAPKIKLTLESATEIVSMCPQQDERLSPLNLSMPVTVNTKNNNPPPKNSATGNNNAINTTSETSGYNIVPSPGDIYADALLSGCLEKLQVDSVLHDPMAYVYSLVTRNTENQVNTTDFGENWNLSDNEKLYR